MIFAEKIALLLQERNMELKAVCRAAQIPYSTMRNYLSPKYRRLPTIAQGLRLARHLGVPLAWLADDEEEPPPPPALDAPPFLVRPWPPDGLSWGELQVAIAAYVLERYRQAIQAGQPLATNDPQSQEKLLVEAIALLQTVAPYARRLTGDEQMKVKQAAIRAAKAAAAGSTSTPPDTSWHGKCGASEPPEGL